LPAKSRFKNTRLAVNDQSRPDNRSDGNLHTICSCKEGDDLGLIWRNIKSFTAMKLIDVVINNLKESRKEYLLHTFETEGKKSSSNFKHKFWEHENHKVLLDNTEMYNQRLNYLPAR
jgi:hypothetical protein